MLTHTAAVEQAVNAYKQALQEGFAQQRQNLNTELQLGGERKNELDEKVREKRAQRSREWNQWEQDNMRYIVAYQGAGKTGELFYDTLNWKKELDERTVLIEAKRELLSRKEQERDTEGAEKLRALILMDEQSADYQEALHQPDDADVQGGVRRKTTHDCDASGACQKLSVRTIRSWNTS